MINTLLGIKKGMTATYDSRGRRSGATILEVTPNWVTQVKTVDTKDGYNAVQIGIGTKKSVRKPQLGHLKKAKIDTSLRFMREVRTEESADVKPGQELNLGQVFSKGDAVKVTATSKGRGFQGGVKRYNFKGGPKTHGQSDRHRAPGSIGQTTTPGRVYKGKHMAGHYGMDQVSLLGVEVIKVDKKNNLLTIKGGVPGPIGGLVRIEKQGRIKGYTPPPEEKEDEEEEAKQVEARNPESDQVMEQSATPELAEPSTVETNIETLADNPEATQTAKEASENTEGEDQNA